MADLLMNKHEFQRFFASFRNLIRSQEVYILYPAFREESAILLENFLILNYIDVTKKKTITRNRKFTDTMAR